MRFLSTFAAFAVFALAHAQTQPAEPTGVTTSAAPNVVAPAPPAETTSVAAKPTSASQAVSSSAAPSNKTVKQQLQDIVKLQTQVNELWKATNAHLAPLQKNVTASAAKLSTDLQAAIKAMKNQTEAKVKELQAQVKALNDKYLKDVEAKINETNTLREALLGSFKNVSESSLAPLKARLDELAAQRKVLEKQLLETQFASAVQNIVSGGAPRPLNGTTATTTSKPVATITNTAGANVSKVAESVSPVVLAAIPTVAPVVSQSATKA